MVLKAKRNFFIKWMSIRRELVRRLLSETFQRRCCQRLAKGEVQDAIHVYSHITPPPRSSDSGTYGGDAQARRPGIKAGRMLDSGGLMPVAAGAQVRITNGELSVVDGPFVETKEVIGGYAIFELRDKEEAVAAAVEFMQLHKDFMPGWEGTCEVRSL